MASKIQYLSEQGLLNDAPDFVVQNSQYEVIMGSTAYGVSSDSSDQDLYGFTMPPKGDLFPHLHGYICGFDELPKPFEQFQKHAIKTNSGENFDITSYSISKYFRLLAQCNPNIIDSLFVPERCIVHVSPLARRVRDHRHLFVHKGCWQTFKGYAYTQLHKIRTKKPIGSRVKIVEEFGYDVKFAYHVVRLLNEAKQLLAEGTVDLEANREQLKAIRRGEWSLAELERYCKEQEANLEKLYVSSQLPVAPDMDKIKQLLFSCLEEYYGSLKDAVDTQIQYQNLIRDMKNLLNSV